MRKKFAALLGMTFLASALVFGCGNKSENVEEDNTAKVEDTVNEDQAEETPDCELEDGTYSAEFNTDSGMFHVNEAC